MKKSIIIYADCIAILEELTYEQAGRLFKAVLSYANEEPVTEINDPAVKMAFKVLKTQIDRDAKKYETICNKRRENINKRWHKEGQKPDDTKGMKSIQVNTNVNNGIQMGYDSENDSDSDSESTNVDVKEPSNEGKKTTAAVAATLSKVRSIEDRQKAFYDTLRPYVEKYPKEMLRAFYDWWSEPNRSKTKMRVELEKTWDLSRRLATWHKKDEERKFNGTANRTNNSAEQRAVDAASIVARLAEEDDARQ
jgi:hypothetical protein